MNKTRSQGFTLIELLVVIAIIGILSAVVLASMNSARTKGQDSTIISDMTNLRTQAGIYQVEHNNYGAPISVSDCTTGMFADTTIAAQRTGIMEQNGGVDLTCHVSANGRAYAVAAQLVTDPTNYYCVDSTGESTTTSSNTISADGDVVCSS